MRLSFHRKNRKTHIYNHSWINAYLYIPLIKNKVAQKTSPIESKIYLEKISIFFVCCREEGEKEDEEENDDIYADEEDPLTEEEEETEEKIEKDETETREEDQASASLFTNIVSWFLSLFGLCDKK